MKTSPQGRALIESFESDKLVAYLDGGGVWTIGRGHTGPWVSLSGDIMPGVHRGLTWTQAQSDATWERDILLRELQLSLLLGKAPTTQGQWDAMLSLGFNVGLGRGGLKTSTLLRMHKAGEYAQAALQFARWNKDNGKVVRGLTRRREAERLLYISKD